MSFCHETRPMTNRPMLTRRTATSLLLATPFGATSAQDKFPKEAVHFVVAFAPGGVADVIGRVVGARLEQRWGQPAVVDNRGGAGGNIAAKLMTQSPATGYRVLVTTSAYAVNPSLSANAGYTPGKELAAVIVAATTPNIIITNGNSPLKTLADVAKLAGQRPITYGTAGVGTTPHLSAERILKIGAGLAVTHVPYSGAGPAVNAALGGHVDIASVGLSAASELVKSGMARGLAVTSPKRAASLPDVPTVEETGFGKVDDATWVAFFVPAATPQAIVAQMNADLNAVLALPEIKANFEKFGFEAIGGTPADATAFVASEATKWGSVVAALGIKID
jgi:tripartite-type tricarboxylate transporter receptor subunit TctC